MSMWNNFWSFSKNLVKEFAQEVWEGLKETAKENPGVFTVMNWARIAISDGIYDAEHEIAKHVRSASEEKLEIIRKGFRHMLGTMQQEGQIDRLAAYGQLYEYFNQCVAKRKR